MDRALRDRIIDHVIGLEGGYVDDPLDSGGRTRWGITEAVARRAGYEGPMAELPVSVARGIYISEYWDALNLDAIGASCPALAAEAFEAGVNCGVTRAGRWLQRALNALNDGGRRWADVAVDGSIGPASLSALAGAARQRWRAPDVDATLAALLNILQGGHYVDLAERREKDERFLRGWLVNRVMAPALPWD